MLNKIEFVQNMFRDIFEAINPTKIPNYFSNPFHLETNGEIMDYDQFVSHVGELVNTHAKVKFHFPFDDAFLSTDGKKAVTRYRIETEWKSGRHDELIVMAIYEFENGKISKWWETVHLLKSSSV